MSPRNGLCRVLCFSVALISTGCAVPTVVDEQSHFYPPPVGTVIELRRDVSIAPGKARATIQRGEIVPGIRPSDTWCQLEVRDVMPVPQTVRADIFTVRKVSRENAEVVAVEMPVRVASMGMDSGGTSDVTLIWHLWLTSPQQPNVLRLSCGGAYDAPSEARHLSLQELRATLGSVATLSLPGADTAPP